MSRRILKSTFSWRVDCLAAAYSTRAAEWEWATFDSAVSELARMTIRTIVTRGLTSGEVSGVALVSDDGTTGIIVIPEETTLEHQIHIASHEAWHLIAGHKGCSAGLGEDQAEEFARLVGVSVRTRQGMASGRWYRLVGVV